MGELWKDVKNYEGLYKISNHGRVWTNKYKKYLKQMTSQGGYFHVSLSKRGKVRKYDVHRLVALNFLSMIEGKNIVNHLDENKKNNHADNLEWCTQKENINHGTGIQRALETKKTSEKVKISYEIRSVPVVGVNILDGSKIEYASMAAAEKDGFRNGSISNCILGKSNTHAGYKWYKKSKQRTLLDDMKDFEKQVEKLEEENKQLKDNRSSTT
ncbi:MAG: NUMOD4 motif-containing HNH endonuclease [Staphylococcus equorum]|nr:NUMOD4 motif-containing HNH endonuclease [Staphylococcus equorum]MDN6849481.1 NUMOD4 motif-containing HNH endonuclease [Staphylococcus equorum]